MHIHIKFKWEWHICQMNPCRHLSLWSKRNPILKEESKQKRVDFLHWKGGIIIFLSRVYAENSPKKHENKKFFIIFLTKSFPLQKKIIFLLLFPLLHNEFVTFCDLMESFPFCSLPRSWENLSKNESRKGMRWEHETSNTIFWNLNSHSTTFFGYAWNSSKGPFNMWTTRVHNFLIFMLKMIMYIVIEVHIFASKLWEFRVYDM